MDPSVHCAFLSSLTWQFEGGERTDRISRLREAAWHENRGRLWVAEHDDEPLGFRPPLEIVDALLNKVQSTSTFICLLAGDRQGFHDHGTPIEIADRQSAVSYFETELFMAALLQKRIEVIRCSDFHPGPRLSSLLRLLSFAMPRSEWFEAKTDAQAISRVSAVVDDDQPDSWLAKHRRRKAKHRSIWCKYQDAIGNARPRGERIVWFLGGLADKRSVPPNRDLIQQLLDEEQHAPTSSAKLGRIWLVIRELMARPPQEDKKGAYLPYWNVALKRWMAAAGWYGLHGHTDLGFAAAAFSLSRVRRLLKDRQQSIADPEQVAYPGGAIASALFSTAKWMPTRRERRDMLEDGWVHLTHSIDESDTLTSGLLHMQGSYHMALGRIDTGVCAFEDGLRLATEEEINPGVSHSELGAAYLRQGHVLDALKHLKTGADYLKDFKGGESGEYCRALRKLAFGYTCTLQLDNAIKTRSELRAIAKPRGYFDQYR